MKRLHIHVSVQDLQDSVRFYSALFTVEPSVLKADYAKWMLEDPRVNFAISRRGQSLGVDHLGIQAEDAGELNALEACVERTLAPVLKQGETVCCHARSEKAWVVDPQGVPWEIFHTRESAEAYGQDHPHESSSPFASCCAPAPGDGTRCCESQGGVPCCP